MAPRGSSEDPKVTALRESRCLNPHPGQVTDEAFLAEEFFDARDAVQVKYEMVRRVTVDGAPVTATAAAFGYSRPSYYQAAAALAESGLEGLVPARPGPRGGHKLTGEILAWAEQQLAADPGTPARQPGRAHRRGVRGARAPPVDRASAGPPAGATPKAADLPARENRKEENPSLSLRPSPGPAAAEPGLTARMPARLAFPAAGWMPATSNCVMPPCTHARARSRSGSACSPARASPPGGAPWPTWPRPPARAARKHRPSHGRNPAAGPAADR